MIEESACKLPRGETNCAELAEWLGLNRVERLAGVRFLWAKIRELFPGNSTTGYGFVWDLDSKSGRFSD